LLKPIKGDFYNEVNEKGRQALFQFMIDDNLFNSLSSVVVSVDKTFSTREVFKNNPRAKPLFDSLTTTTVGTILPDFTEKYG